MVPIINMPEQDQLKIIDKDVKINLKSGFVRSHKKP